MDVSMPDPFGSNTTSTCSVTLGDTEHLVIIINLLAVSHHAYHT